MNKSLNLPKLEDALIRAGMNQSGLAARLNISREAVSNWMRGESFPQPDKLIRIGMLVGLSFDELVVSHEELGVKPVIEHDALRSVQSARCDRKVEAYGSLRQSRPMADRAAARSCSTGRRTGQ